jgi:hypothetical protein
MRTLRLVGDAIEPRQPTDTDMPQVPSGPRSPAPLGKSASPSQEAAIRHMFEYAGNGQGWRAITIGSTGSGKTYFQRKVVSLSAARDSCVLIHDVKDKVPQYQGAIRDSVFNLGREPVKGNVIVFRHEDPERVAKLGWEMADRGATSTVVVDELFDAMSAPGHFAAKGKSCISEIFRKGRSKGISLLGSTQIPQTLPTVALVCADFKVVFRLDARALDYAQAAFRLSNAQTETIRKLRVGQFVLVEQAADWDGAVYGPH